jgi:hypothetical protein
MSYKFEKVAGIVIDQQDDPGFGWEEISQFWPEDMDEPLIGKGFEKNACIATFGTDSKYPTDTPENTLASTMYFLRFGIQNMTDNEEITKLAQDLKEYRVVHGVSIPSEFIDYIYDRPYMNVDVPDEHYADDNDDLPITTPEQTKDSVGVFMKNASRWPVLERISIAESLQDAANFHELEDVMIKEASYRDASEHFSGAIQLRLITMDKQRQSVEHELGEEYDGDFFEMYKSAMLGLQEDVDEDPFNVASLLESIDTEFGMNDGWGTLFPDPLDSVFLGVNAFAGLEKSAASYDGVDYEGLRGDLEDYIVDAIVQSPSDVIPTLPVPQKEVVEQYIRSKRG